MKAFGEFLPDQPDFGNQGLLKAINAVPINRAYESLGGFGGITAAIDARAQGGISFQDNNGVVYTFVGDETKLYSLGAAVWNDVSQFGGYTTPNDAFWEMVKYGNLAIATNGSNDVQKFDTTSSILFSDLSATAPKAKHIAVAGDFVFLGNVDDSIDGVRAERVWWSPIGNPEGVWTPDQATQCDYQDLPDSVGITRMIGVNNDCLIITERDIQRFVYVGTPTIFNRYVLENNKGCDIPGSVVPYGQGFFYYCSDGFQFFNGTGSDPIGETKIDEYFKADLDQANQFRIIGSIDPNRSLVFWAYPSINTVDGQCDKLMIYNWNEQRWGTGVISIDYMFPGLSRGYTLEELDQISLNVDTLPYSLDSRVWTGGRKSLYAFNEQYILGSLDGTALPATLESGEFQVVFGRRAFIEKVRSITDGGSTTIAMGTREKLSLGVPVTYSPDFPLNGDDEAQVDSESRYHRVVVKISGGFNNCQGFELVNIQDAGNQ